MKKFTVLLSALVFLWCKSGCAATFSVNSAMNMSDSNIGDGICRTIIGNCSLVAAIQEANGNPGSDTITFTSAMIFNLYTAPIPAITGDGLIIDGSSQWNGSRPGIEINNGSLTISSSN